MIRILIISLFILSCAKEEFQTQKVAEEEVVEVRKESSNSECSNFHYDRPPVDLLFIWDNSSSSSFISDETKVALNSLVSNIENRFDYNVMMVPLIASGNEGAYFFSASGHNPGNGITTIATNQAANYIQTIGSFTSLGSEENGASRTVNLIKNNQSNGVFREGAYTIVVLMSNGDDNSFIPEDVNDDAINLDYLGGQYAKGKAHDLLCLRGFYDTSKSSLHNNHSTFNSNCSDAPSLNSTMFRFVSISALFQRSQCNVTSYLRQNIVYRNMSRHVYNTPYSNGYTFPTINYTNPEEGQDQFNLCRGNFEYLFDGVNNAITDAIIKHSYRFWRLAESDTRIDKSSVVVTTKSGSSVKTLEKIPNDVIITRDTIGFNDVDSTGSKISGYRILDGTQTVDRRFLPTNGETFTGQVIELFGDAKVTYPTCVSITFKEPYKYFGFYHLDGRPVESTIKFYVNDKLIPQGSSNGWELVKENGLPKYLNNQNILITSPSDRTAASPADNRSGYFLKLNGNAVYTNGDTARAVFDPSAN
ncbi:MAG: hypothetical protein VX341_07690 [Bdellovibrionota bacterium]|nr:hypothetical protein [Bdellovibrionota bacterium]